MPLLEVRNLKKYFPVKRGFFRKTVGHVKAVDDVSFSIEPGEVVGIVGESGCGKSTTGRAAIHLIPPSAGSTFFQGEDMGAWSIKERRKKRCKIQMIFQDPFASLNPRKNIFSQIAEPLIYHNLAPSYQKCSDTVYQVLDQVGLNQEAAARYPHEFSGGQQQRICIARAIALQPELIVCDETVSALDISVQAQILNLLQDLKTSLNLSYLFISHDLSVVHHLCDRVIVLYLGKVMESGSTKEIFESPKHPYTRALLQSVPEEGKEQSSPLSGETPSPLNPPQACPFHTRCPLAEAQCKEIAPPMHQEGEHYWHCIHNS